MTKNRRADALKSLQVLRGFATSKNVENELNQMQQYVEYSSLCDECLSAGLKQCSHPQINFKQSLQQLLHRSTIRPFAIVFFTYVVNYTSIASIQPYIVQIMKSYAIPIDPNFSTVITSIVILIGMIVVMSVIATVGKRKLFLTCLAIAVSCKIVLGE